MLTHEKALVPLRLGALAVSAAAWILLVTAPESACGCALPASVTSLRQWWAAWSPGEAAYEWLVMLFAMMAPMTLPALYRLRSGSFARLRWAMYALFVLGYGAVWMAAGLVLQLAEVALRGAPPQGHGAALAVGLIAVIWQSSPFKQRCLNRCHAHRAPAAFGGAAARGALASGLEHGVWCVGSCWAMMWFPMLLPTGHLVAMAAVTLLMFCERLDPPATPAWRMRGLRTALRWARLQLVGARASARPAAVALPVSRGAARRRAP